MLAAWFGLLSLPPVCAAAQTGRPAPAPPPPPPQTAEPQRTTATFGDWTLRCEHPDGAAELCEVAQIVSANNQPVAQIAIGRTAHGEPLRLTFLVPANVSFPQPARFEAAGNHVADLTLDWRRCLPGGCLAGAALPDEAVRALRARTEPARISFVDGGGKPAAVPFSPKGLVPALDALAKEESGSHA